MIYSVPKRGGGDICVFLPTGFLSSRYIYPVMKRPIPKVTASLFVDPIHGGVKLPESIAPYRGGQFASEFREVFGRILE